MQRCVRVLRLSAHAPRRLCRGQISCYWTDHECATWRLISYLYLKCLQRRVVGTLEVLCTEVRVSFPCISIAKELALLSGVKRTATGRCLTPCELTVLAHDDFHALSSGQDALAQAIRKQAEERGRPQGIPSLATDRSLSRPVGEVFQDKEPLPTL